MKKILFVLALTLLPTTLFAEGKEPNNTPFIVVYIDDPVISPANATITITNPSKDVGMLITSIEFEGQLPTLRYFYHGIYGGIRKKGDKYFHFGMEQQLSRPVGSCFLLPGQSTCWKRPIRVVDEGDKTYISWVEIPVASLYTNIWFNTKRNKERFYTNEYHLLSQETKVLYSNLSVANKSTPYVIVEGDFPEYSKTIQVPCNNYQKGRAFDKETVEEYPDADLEFSLEPIADLVVVTKHQVVFRKYNMRNRKYENINWPKVSPIVADFLFIQVRSREKTIPCILNPKHFGDLLKVETPHTNMYYYPGITQVPLDIFPKIMDRALEQKLDITLIRIDPNSLGRRHVLSIGITVDEKGLQK